LPPWPFTGQDAPTGSWNNCSQATQKLYFGTTLFTMPDRQPIALSPSTAVIELGQKGVETKIAAFKCHTSQSPLFPFFEETVRKRGSQELFHLAASLKPVKAQLETDLFAGVVEGREAIGN
jgi:LmbE family N-acetylglucosaminyl deacetylase